MSWLLVALTCLAAWMARPRRPVRLPELMQWSDWSASSASSADGTPSALTPTSSAARRPATAWWSDDRLRRGTLIAVGATALLVEPALLVALPAFALRNRLRGLRLSKRAERMLLAEVPSTIDLFRLATSGGLTVHESVEAVGVHGRGRMAARFAAASARVRRGAPVADELDQLSEGEDSVPRSLVAVLVESVRYGTALGPALERLAAEERLATRRRAEERARALPVRLLFPLLVCVLPAFVLLGVVPLLVDGLGSFDLPSPAAVSSPGSGGTP